MNKRDLASLALKLTGIYCFVQMLPQLQFALVYLGNTAERMRMSPLGAFSRMAVSSLLMILLTGAAGFALIAFSDRWAGWLAGRSAEDEVNIPVSGPDVQAIAFSVVGVYLFVSALSKLVPTLASLAALAPPSPVLPPSPAAIWPELVGLALQMAVSAWLFFGAARLSHFWRASQQRRVPGTQET